MTTYVSLERQHIERLSAMLKAKVDSISEAFKQRLDGLLKSRIDLMHDELAHIVRRVAYVHDIFCKEAEEVCKHIESEKQRCIAQRESEKPSLIKTNLARLGELSVLVPAHVDALFQRLWDLRKAKITELHDELLKTVGKVCDEFGNPHPSLRSEVEANIRNQMPVRKAA